MRILPPCLHSTQPFLAHMKRTCPIYASLVPTEFENIPADAFDTPGVITDTSLIGDLLMFTLAFFAIAKVLEHMSEVAPEDAREDHEATAWPSAISMPGKAKERKNKIEFGWLHADL
mmetsp:Transcript_52097/g.135121  ORF Transcript_52097/g.135121 Transcript_52097/m.135121 type:complete len:117 (-) Transcript_52097:637-987(-)